MQPELQLISPASRNMNTHGPKFEPLQPVVETYQSLRDCAARLMSTCLIAQLADSSAASFESQSVL